jgi:four helix bundle protein
MATREAAKSFEDLLVWQKAHQVVLLVYEFSALFPRSETYGLTSQLRRAAVSVAANIAEGFRRQRRPDKARMVNIAQASLEECRYYLILAADLSYGGNAELVKQMDEVGRMLNAYTKAVASDSNF